MAWHLDGRRRELVTPHCDRPAVLLDFLSCEEGSHFAWWLISREGVVAEAGGPASWACLRCRCEGWWAGERAEADCGREREREREKENFKALTCVHVWMRVCVGEDVHASVCVCEHLMRHIS